MRQWCLVAVVLLAGCNILTGGNFCSGVQIAADAVITAKHCVPGIALVSGTVPHPKVHVGDILTVVAFGCGGLQTEVPLLRVGEVLALEDDYALLSTFACPGDSGGAVLNSAGDLVGVVVARRIPDNGAVVNLF